MRDGRRKEESEGWNEPESNEGSKNEEESEEGWEKWKVRPIT